MKNFEFKKYFGNLVGLEAISMKTPMTNRPMLQKGVSDARLVKR